MDFRLDGDQELVVATIRRFAEKELSGWAADADREAQAPAKLFSLGGELGFFLDAVPEAADGFLEGAYDHTLRALRGLELGRGCAALSALLESNVEPALAVARWGSADAQKALFDSIAADRLAVLHYDMIGALHIEAGKTLRVSGELGPIVGGAMADHLLLLARSGDEAIVALVPQALATVTKRSTSGWRAGAWARWSFDGAVLEDNTILCRGEAAEDAQRHILSWARVSLAARAIGVATAAMEHAGAYCEDRKQFGQPIGAFESLLRMRDRNETAIRAGRLLVLEAATLLDAEDVAGATAASRARDFAADVVTRATIDAVQMYGGYGFVNDYPVEKLMRDARAFEVLHGNEAFSRVLDLRASYPGTSASAR